MGHKEDLLGGAKKCLLEKGYAHTTARDIVAASGTNLASIGYHFGSTEALMGEAMMALMGEWGDKFEPRPDAPQEASSLARFEGTWRRLYGLFAKDRALLLASYEIMAQIDRLPQLRSLLSGAYEEMRGDFARVFLLLEDDIDPAELRAMSSLLLALMTGLITQHLLDPERAPSIDEVIRGLRLVVARIGE
ncbi:TetR/AcrR family transcriptional regulator [Pelagibacterium lentulum]|uniref:TetR family transcriptional regulator n=1 Tax=Pelagibacterium lentulum TaxID=2029865 RepID=A0A916RNF5_9HYPH|nr:TetR/AcrR family transcriptional regulator [Pelagibacterium lentulum]GGA62700.1 TetR family transcriptional regulator [Pelagibacterium lentulum]